jgi:UDP-glucose 4-epimerase
MTVLITGVSGNLAQLVATALIAQQERVVGVDRRPWPDAPAGVEVVSTDILATDAEDIFRRERPAAVVHMATVTHLTTSRHERYRINLVGTQKLLEYCERYEVPQVLFVSRHTYYGASPDAALYRTENEPPMALESFPELADLVAADLFATSTLWRFPERATAILRLVYTLGPSLQGTLATFLAGRRVPMVLGFDPLFQFMHEQDAAAAIVLSLKSRLRGVFNVAGPQALPLSEVIRTIERVPARMVRSMFPLMLGRFGLPKLPLGALDHVKYPVVVSDEAFRRATGYRHEHGEYETLLAFRSAAPPGGPKGASSFADPPRL